MSDPTDRPPLDLRRPRDVGPLISDGFGLYFRHFGVLVALSAAVVIPVELIVSGIGLGQLTSEYDTSPEPAEAIIPALTQALVVGPLITAMCLYVMLDDADGKRPRFASALQRGLDLFAPLLLVVAMIVVGVVAGLFLLIIPGVYLGIRLLFAPASVVVEGKRGVEALVRSGELIKGSWWRCFGVMLLTYLVVGLPANLVQQGFAVGAEEGGSAAIALAGQIIAGTLGAPLLALIAGLLYFDQRLRTSQ